MTGRALKGTQIELRSLTSESWTEPRKWKSFLNVHKKNILRPSLHTYPTGIVHTSSSGRADFLLPLGGWRIEVRLFEEMTGRAAIKRGIISHRYVPTRSTATERNARPLLISNQLGYLVCPR
jgi:hypothetical protein